MKTIDEQLAVIRNLVGDVSEIKVKEDGFLSRGFVINNGEIVFKFPRNKDVRYGTEIVNLNYINSLNLGIHLQKVAYEAGDNSYLGIYGVMGQSLEELRLSEEDKKNVGLQLGQFLRTLHNAKTDIGERCPLQAEIDAWQKRVLYVNEFITNTFDKKEQDIINFLMFDYMPKELGRLGEKLVFSHGDLGDGNIFIDKDGKVGVIDFNSSGPLDEAGDFMDVKSDTIRNAMLDAYQADEVLRKKVEIRRDIRSLIVLKPYLSRNDSKMINELVANIRKSIAKYEQKYLDSQM